MNHGRKQHQNAGQQHRAECEAREWLKRGYTSKQAVDELITTIAKKRGPQAAQQLREEMRRQFKKQREQKL